MASSQSACMFSEVQQALHSRGPPASGAAGFSRQFEYLGLGESEEVRLIVRFVDYLNVWPAAVVAPQGLFHNPAILGQDLLIRPCAKPFRRRSISHINVAEPFGSDLVPLAPG